MLKNAHLLRSPYPSSLQRTSKYASLLRTSGALHLGIFEHPQKKPFSQHLDTESNDSYIYCRPRCEASRFILGIPSTRLTSRFL